MSFERLGFDVKLSGLDSMRCRAEVRFWRGSGDDSAWLSIGFNQLLQLRRASSKPPSPRVWRRLSLASCLQ